MIPPERKDHPGSSGLKESDKDSPTGWNKPRIKKETKMKKLMIAAAAAAMIGGANAVCVSGENECEVCGAGGANVWDVKFTAKTTVLKAASGTCSVGLAYRKQGTAKITGWLWNSDDCTGACDLEFGANNADAAAPRMALTWNKKFGFAVTPSIFVAQIDKKGNKHEAWGGLNDGGAVDIKFAGFGSYDLKKNYIKSLSGSFAGTLENELVGSKCAIAVGGIYNYACKSYSYGLGVPTAAYGSWSIKYNATASKKAAKAAAGLGINQGEGEEEDDEIELDAAVASVLKFSKYGIDPASDIADVEILIEDFASDEPLKPEDAE